MPTSAPASSRPSPTRRVWPSCTTGVSVSAVLMSICPPSCASPITGARKDGNSMAGEIKRRITLEFVGDTSNIKEELAKVKDDFDEIVVKVKETGTAGE